MNDEKLEQIQTQIGYLERARKSGSLRLNADGLGQ